MLLFELEELEDLLHTLVFENEPSIFNEETVFELMETVFHLVDNFLSENPHIVSEPNFYEIVLDEITNLFYIQIEDHINKNDYIEDELDELLEDILNIVLDSFNLNKIDRIEQDKRETEALTNNFISITEDKIQKLREIPQPLQRTPEWYVFRWNLITASNAWKALENQTIINQLIYEKCQPLKNAEEDEPIKLINTNTSLHWGQKYEPVSILLYENIYNTQIEDFGCIQHPIYNFLGASPDGINVDQQSTRYGRMLEIKNVVSRDINGIPKKEYWTQMQLQMEVCDLNECDFLETKFIEYPSTQDFYEDCKIDENEGKLICKSKDGKTKGIIMCFHTKTGGPFYCYKPLNIISETDIENWEESELAKYESEPYNYVFMKFLYWKLEVFSCVLVQRNTEWFKNNIGQLDKVWKTILAERISGYEHRAPNKKAKKESLKPFVDTTSSGCLLNLFFKKVNKLDS